MAQIVAKGQRTPLFLAAVQNHVHVVRVWPMGRTVKKRTHRIVSVRKMHVAQHFDGVPNESSGARLATDI